MMKIALKKHISLVIVSLLALIFFISTASFNHLTQNRDYIKWSSPDETANYFFTKKFSETGQLAFFDAAGVIGDNLIMPRSVRSDSGLIKPVSFLGMILIYGFLASWLGTAIIPFLTPLFAALGIIIFYFIVRRLWGDRVALWSACLLATFPVFIYYTVRSMFHNVLFVVLLLAAVQLFILALGREREKEKLKFLHWPLPSRAWYDMFLSLAAGLTAGLALITRTSELLWLAPLFLLIVIFYSQRLGAAKLMLMFIGLCLPLLPIAYYNQILYGAFWYGGYNEMNRSFDDIAHSSESFWQMARRGDFSVVRDYLSQIFHQVFYFGFKFDQSLLMFKHYVIDMFPALFYAGLAGLVLSLAQLIRRFDRKYLFYIIGWLALSIFLIFYYGSWKFNDNPDLTRFTIGNSYTRYWLPIYLGLIPLAALALVKISRAVTGEKHNQRDRLSSLAAWGVQAVVIAAFSILSLIFVLYGSEEGLAYLYYNSKEEASNTAQVLSLTKPDGVIITRYYDKFFWPERRIIMGTIPGEEVFAAAAKLIKYYPVYYYNFYLNATDLNYLNERRLKPYNLQIQLIEKTNIKFGLYQLLYRQPETATGSPEVLVK